MNFNYSYKAFLIASLIVGNLFLWLYVIKLSKRTTDNTEEYLVEYSIEDLLTEEELIAISTENVKIETHSAYNEDEEFISELEDQNKELSESTLEKLNEMEEAIDKSLNDKIEISDSDLEEKPIKEEVKDFTTEKSINRNSTNSYRLKDRKALFFPNPVYTCEAFGKVVLHIEVNDLGKVIHTSLNKSSSTTSNLCLIESAIKYAEQTRFTTKAGIPKQMGTITYIFPGQY